MKVYFNNDYYDSDAISVSSDNQHFRYGAGFFETILFNGVELEYLDEHVKRIKSSSKDFGYDVYDFDYKGVIDILLEKNIDKGSMARVNICHMSESADRYTVFTSVVPYYQPPVNKVYKLCVYPGVHDTYLNKYKTTNYMHFTLAKKFAADKGCDDALLVDADGYLMEASTAALLFEKDDELFKADSPNILKSITMKMFEKENEVKPKKIHINEIEEYDLYLMNSLIKKRKAELTL